MQKDKSWRNLVGWSEIWFRSTNRTLPVQIVSILWSSLSLMKSEKLSFPNLFNPMGEIPLAI